MINLTSDMLHALQSTELELLCEVDRICRKHNIKYSLDGGTLLGAFRHDGFIPWDDDADVMMTREQYDLFYEACKGELDYDKFFLQEFRTDNEYRWGYSKLRKNNTVFLREGQEHIKCHTGVCIDIFVFDEVPDNYILRRLHWIFCLLIRKGLYSTVGVKNSSLLIKKVLYGILAIFPRAFWVNCLMNLSKYERGKNRELISHLTYPNRKQIRYGLPAKLFSEYIEKDFEGHELMVLKEYDEYLKALFDDYMKLPPENERKIHPVSRIEL